MNADRRATLWSAVVDRAAGSPVRVEHVCATAVSTGGVDGAALAVMLEATPRETVYVSDRIASELEELALTLGEGPCVEAFFDGPALVADVTAPECLRRWPLFAPAAARVGVRAVFALPLRVGAIRLGVMDLYRATPGVMSRSQVADLLELADTACALLLDAAESDGSRFDGQAPEPAGLQHPEVHRATGIVTVQLGVSAAVALVRLRAYAYSSGRRLRDVAGDVVARTLRLGTSDNTDASDRDDDRDGTDDGTTDEGGATWPRSS